ncbi:MAG TPA: MFS transporter [Gemmataceae bacterium]|nr:MFS transporter [Gemmataceae bacterium]
MNKQTSPPPVLTPPTRVRYGVLGFACTLSMITYLDRVCFGAASPDIIHELGLSGVSDLTWAYFAFTFSYAALEIPSGWLGDVFGPRKTLIRIVLWWSLFTALTGLVGIRVSGLVFGSLGLLVAVRFLFGMGEAGAYPNLTRALHNWFPRTDRAWAQGILWMSARLMGGLTPFVWWVVVEKWGLSWRAAFVGFGVIGTLWCLAFAVWFRNRPEEKREVNEAELALIQAGRSDVEAAHAKVPWMNLVKNPHLWALCLMYFCAAYGWYFNITFLPSCLETQYGVKPDSVVGAIYKGGPLWMGAITCMLGGWLSDRFIRRTGNRKWGRRLFGMVGHGLCGLCYLACLIAPNAFSFFLAISFAAFWNDLTMGPAWATCQDTGRRYAAIVAGCMNMVGNFGGAAAASVTGAILVHYQSAYAAAHGVAFDHLDAAHKTAAMMPGYQVNYAVFAAVYFIAMFLWLGIDATKPAVPDPQ